MNQQFNMEQIMFAQEGLKETADTVIDANAAALRVGAATGFVHAPGSAEALTDAIRRACALFRDRDAWRGLVRAALRQPVDWDESAARYADLYRRLAPAAPAAAPRQETS